MQPTDPATPPINQSNWLAPQNLRWALRHSRQVIPTAVIGRGDRPTLTLPVGPPINFDRLSFSDAGQTVRLSDYLESAAVDAFLVLHRGQIIYQRMLAGMTRDQPHQWASMTKAVTGLLAVLLAGEGAIDPGRPLGGYVPELAGSPFGVATLQQNLDMEVSVDWPADVTEMHWMAAVGLVPNLAGVPATMRQFLPQVGRSAATPHGAGFRYNNSCTEAVAWALCNATGKGWPQLVSERIWSRLDAEQDATVIVDSAGTAQASGGLSSTAGDLAHFAEILRTGGRVGDRQALPAASVAAAVAPHAPGELPSAVERFARGNIAIGRPGFSYRNGFFHLNDPDGSLQMSGRFGQRVHINPAAEMTVVQFAAYPGPGEETAAAFLAATRAIADTIAGG